MEEANEESMEPQPSTSSGSIQMRNTGYNSDSNSDLEWDSDVGYCDKLKRIYFKNLFNKYRRINLERELEKLRNTSASSSPSIKSAELSTTENVDSDLIELEDIVKIHFRVNNLSTLCDCVNSKSYLVRDLNWQLLVIPKKDKSMNFNSLGVFIKCYTQPDFPFVHWECEATAQLRLMTFNSDEAHLIRNIQHSFNERENDWGFSCLISYSDLLNPNSGYVKYDSFVVEADIKPGVTIPSVWNSKKLTGYNGIINTGATCYINSLLQVFYFTSSFCESIFKVPLSNNRKSIILGLQEVFYDLKESHNNCYTKRLTRAFGWNKTDLNSQQDVQEFLRVFLNKLEIEMKDANVESTIPSLLQGQLVSFIKCKNIPYESRTVETFYDIQLNIKGKKNIIESFNDYVKVELLEDKYDAGEHGFQEAEKGLKFLSFPPILYLHLLRFQYDPILGHAVKCNDRFEFTKKIDLDPYLSKTELIPAVYKLFAVLVHSGDNEQGHYVVYIDPKITGHWFKFNDSVVTISNSREAVESNYGGNTNYFNSSAYMLVYIKEVAISQILKSISSQDIPADLKNKFIKEREARNASVELDIDLYVVLDELVASNKYSNFYDMIRGKPLVYRIKKTQTCNEVFQMLSDKLAIKESRMRVWPLFQFLNVLRPYYVSDKLKDGTLNYILLNEGRWMVYIQQCSENQIGPIPPFDQNDDLLISFKYFDAENNKVNYLGTAQYSKHNNLAEILPEVCRNGNLPALTALKAYEEREITEFEEINDFLAPLRTVLLYNGEATVHGTTIILQKKNFNRDVRFKTCEEYFDHFINRTNVLFEECQLLNDKLTLNLPIMARYIELAQAVGRKKKHNPRRIQFFMCKNSDIGDPIKSDFSGVLRDILDDEINPKLFFQLLTKPLAVIERETKNQCKCLWVHYSFLDEQEICFSLKENNNVRDLLEEAKNYLEFNKNSTQQLRLVEINNRKIIKIIEDSTPLVALKNLFFYNKITQKTCKYYRIEEVQRYELDLTDRDCFISITHFNRILKKHVGQPFLIKISHNEMFASIKNRIKLRLKIKNELEWKNFKFFVVSKTETAYITSDNYKINIDNFKMSENDYGIRDLPFIGLSRTQFKKLILKRKAADKIKILAKSVKFN